MNENKINEKEMIWIDITPKHGIWKPETPGDTITGKLLTTIPAPYKGRPNTKYCLQTQHPEAINQKIIQQYAEIHNHNHHNTPSTIQNIIQLAETDLELECKYTGGLCPNTHTCHECPHFTRILAENIDANTYDYFIDNADIISDEKHPQYGYYLTEALKLYLKTVEQGYLIDLLIENVNKNITITTDIMVTHIHPQIHQKFKKYLQKKYKTINTQKHYSRELNTALAIYVNCIQIPQLKSIEEYPYNLQETDTLYEECTEEVDIK